MRTGSSRLTSFLVVGATLVAVAAPSTAHAFTTNAKQPTEFGSKDLARVVDPLRQKALNETSEWRAFQAIHGAEWRATWDDRAGTPRSIIGGKIRLVPTTASATEVDRASRAFLDTLQSLSGVDSSLLRTAVLTNVRGTWFVRFDRVTAAGDSILGAYAELRIVRGNVVLIRLETHPTADVGLQAPKLSAAAAAAKADLAIGAFLGTSRLAPAKARRVIVPIAIDGGWAYRHGFEIESSSLATAGAGRWRSVVDAVHGEVLSRESLIRYAVGGTIRGNVEARTVTDAPAPLALPFIRPTVGGTPVNADEAGVFTSGAADGSSVTLRLSGAFISVSNQAAGGDLTATYSATGANGDYTWSNTNGQALAQLDSYQSTAVVRKWALDVVPGMSWLQGTLPVNVNIGDQCNAYWDGSSMNFFDEGNFCNNTARIADVVYHEFGHGFHQNNAVSGVIDGAIGEGTGDYIAATITSSPDVGPNFQKNGEPVREIEGNRVYPDDLVGQVHTDGLIWAGSMWDLRKALIATHGDALGRSTADGIFARALSAGPTLDQAYEEVLLADDDNGDLTDGTPNQCDIDAAFGIHGLTGSAAGFSLAHAELTRDDVTAGQAITVSAALPETTSLCPGGGISAATLRYKIADGATQSVSLTLNGNTFSGELPGIEAGNVVRYWFEGTTDAGNTVTTPPAAPSNAYSFYVGPLFTIFEDDFEASTEWEHGGTGDEWEIGTPAGAADPVGAYQGTKAFGTALGGNGEYRPDSNSWAETPVINCGGCSGTRLQYRRWLTVEDGQYDNARIVLVSGDDRFEVFENPVGNGGEAVRDRIWGFTDIDISEFADGRNFKVRFELVADQGLEFGGWTIDSFAVVSPAAPGSGGGGGGYGLFGCSVTTTRATTLPLSALLLSLGALGAMLRRRRT